MLFGLEIIDSVFYVSQGGFISKCTPRGSSNQLRAHSNPASNQSPLSQPGFEAPSSAALSPRHDMYSYILMELFDKIKYISIRNLVIGSKLYSIYIYVYIHVYRYNQYQTCNHLGTQVASGGNSTLKRVRSEGINRS